MINKTFRLFISSTFSDFLDERQILNDKIQEEISDFCQSKGYFFQLIDLRWGINSESALMQNTLSICLEEVRRCTENSPKPNFLLLLGERYGWIPLPQKIPQNVFESILSVSTTEELHLLLQWYRLDENEHKTAYFLCVRSGEYENDNKWSETENRLRTILITNAAKNRVTPEQMMEMTTSATEREIIDGLLGRPDVGDNVIAVFRTGFPDKDSDLSSILALRKKIKERMQHNRLSNHILELDYGEADYAAQFQTVIADRLKQAIRKEIQRIETRKKETEDHHVLHSIMVESGSTYCQRADLIRQVQNYVCGKSNVPLFIIGEPGSGKSTILADFLIHSEIQSFYVFFGYGEHSYNLYSAISYLSKSMQEYCDRSNISEYAIGGKALAAAMNRVPAGEKILLVIDGLNAFYDLDEVRENLIPSFLPDHIKMIVSSANKTAAQRFMGDTAQLLEIDSLSADESQKLLREHLSCKGRCITNADQNSCIERTLPNGATPLQIKLLAALCAQWKSYDRNVQLPIAAEDAVLEYIRTMFLKRGHNEHLVLYALALVAVSPAGITEDMLTELLLKFASVQDYFKKEDRYRHNLNKMPFVIWSRLFFDLKDGLRLEQFKGGVVVRFRHHLFRKMILRTYPEYCTEAREQLERYFITQPHCTPNGTPNFLKLQTYPILLKELGKTGDLQTIFVDLDYINASVKAGLLDHVIEELMHISSMGEPTYQDQANAILRCIQQCQERLMCNKGDFLNCAYDCGLTDGMPPILSDRKNRTKKRLYFPHSSNSRIVWAEDQSQYAVLCETEVWLCNANPYTEQVYINVNLDIQDKEHKIINAFWLSQERIAIQVENGLFLVYSYAGSAPHLFDRFSFDTKNQNAAVIPAMGAMAYIHDGNLCVRKISEKEVLYQIPLKSRTGVFFSVRSDLNTLILCRQFTWIEEYDLCTGQKIFSQKVKLARYLRLYLDAALNKEKFYISKLYQNRWLLYCPQDLWYAVIEGQKVAYLQVPSLPNHEKSNVDLPGHSVHIVSWDQLLILIDFSNQYRLRFYTCQHISDIAWIVPDQSISVLTDQGLHVVNLDEFQELGTEGVSCLCSDLDLQHTVLFLGDGFNRHSIEITSYLKFGNMVFFSKDDDSVQYNLIFKLDGRFVNQFDRKATIVSFSNDGKKAVAYEGMNTIVIFDAEENPQIVIDRLQLALNDNILDIFFSPDGKYLVIWRNHSIVAVDTESGRYSLQLDTALRPVLSTVFDGNGCLKVTLYDKKTYTFICNRNTDAFECADPLPDRLTAFADTDAYWGPYTVYPLSHKRTTIPLIHSNSFDDVPQVNLRSTRIYHSKNYWLLFKNGEFYLDGDLNKPFSHPYIDFGKCLDHEKRKDNSLLSGYLRAKNDILSILFEPDAEHLVLISRGLNAVIVFDLKRNLISAMHKLAGSIIGVQKLGRDSIELICAEEPTLVIIDLELPCH